MGNIWTKFEKICRSDFFQGSDLKMRLFIETSCSLSAFNTMWKGKREGFKSYTALYLCISILYLSFGITLIMKFHFKDYEPNISTSNEMIPP